MSKYNNLSKEELLRLIDKQENELKNKKYGLVWDSEKKPEKVVLDCENNLPILERVKDKEIKTNEEEDNILIEGDNYHALTVLNYTHKEKIDVIYIDPPYNTGNKDFKYNDAYVDKEDGFRHSKWLNFMEKRLNLAKSLLNEKGIIFISIDENEVYQLKLLCDKIFSEKNFVTNIKLKVKAAAGVGQEGFLHDICEYVLMYAKDSSKIINGTPNIEEPIGMNTTKMYNNILSSFGKDKKIDSIKGGIVGNIDVYEHKDYEIEKIPTIKRDMKTYYSNFDKIFRTTNPQGGLMKRVMPKLPKKGLISIEYKPTKGRNKGQLYRYYFYNGALLVWLKDSALKDKENKIVGKLVRNNNLWIENLHQGIASEGGVNFKNGKKPTRLIKKLIDLYKDNLNITVLDFFAGSGTTGHALLDMNNDDKGKRKFILCTNNEEKICTDFCYPRIKNVISGHGNNKKLGGNLQYFQTNFVKKTNNRDQVKLNLTHECTEMLCVKEGIFNIEKEKEDFKIFSSNKKDKFLCIYYNFIEDSFKDFLKEIRKLEGKKHIYIFSLDNKVDEGLFFGIKDLTIETIPQKILDIYKQLVRLNIKGNEK